MRHFPDTISSLNFHSNLELLGGIVPFEAFLDSSREGIVETRAVRAEPHASC